MLLVAKGVTCLDVFESDDGDDVTRLCGIDLVAVVSVHFHHAGNTLGLASKGVEDGVALLDRARVDTGEGEKSTKGVSPRIHKF